MLSCAPAWADRGTEQVAFAASGRYDQLEQLLEAQLAKRPLDTRDRHALCYAYSKTRRHARLMACLDQLASNLKRGDKATRLCALDDATPAARQHQYRSEQDRLRRRHAALYGRAIACALALGDKDRAYDYMEKAKSRALVDLLAGKGANLALKGQDAASGELLGALEDAADLAQTQLPLNMSKAGAAESRAIVKGHAQALKQRDPALASLVSVGALSLPEVRRFLRADEVLIEYYVNGFQLVLVGVGPSSTISATFAAAPLAREVRDFRAAIEGRKANTQALAQALYTRLPGPVAGLIAGRNLVIVPHGSLHYQPFAALHDGAGYMAASHNMR